MLTLSRRTTQAVTHVTCVSCLAALVFYRLLDQSSQRDCLPCLHLQAQRTDLPLARTGGQKCHPFPSERTGVLWLGLFRLFWAQLSFGSILCSDLKDLPTLRVNSSFRSRHVGGCRSKPAPLSCLFVSRDIRIPA
jgi:hypothetical protein